MKPLPPVPVETIPDGFPTTRWTEVWRAGNRSHPANARGWEWVAGKYWYPLYACARRTGLNPDEAADLTQEFFAWMIESALPAAATPERGRFRSLLLTAFKNRLGMGLRRQKSLKRGGGRSPISLDAPFAEERYRAEPADLASPDRLFERRWTLDLIQRALDRLEAEVNARRQPALFARLKATLLDGCSESRYDELAVRLGMSEGAVKAAVHRLRERFRALVREEVADAVPDAGEIEEELRRIRTVLSGAS